MSCTIGSINRVLLNLVINAVHAMEDVLPTKGHGTLTLRAGLDGDHAVINVADTGTFTFTTAQGEGTTFTIRILHASPPPAGD